MKTKPNWESRQNFNWRGRHLELIRLRYYAVGQATRSIEVFSICSGKVPDNLSSTESIWYSIFRAKVAHRALWWATVDFSTGRGKCCLLGRWLGMGCMPSDGHDRRESWSRERGIKQELSRQIGWTRYHVIWRHEFRPKARKTTKRFLGRYLSRRGWAQRFSPTTSVIAL